MTARFGASTRRLWPVLLMVSLNVIRIFERGDTDSGRIFCDVKDFERKMAGRHPSRPLGITAVGIFLFLGAAMCALAGETLIWRGTTIERIWELNPTAYRLLAPHGTTVGPLFFLLGTMMIAAGIGWLRGRHWGWVLTVIIFATQCLGDLVNCLRGDLIRGSIGFVIAGALLMYLLSPKVRGSFATRSSINN